MSRPLAAASLPLFALALAACSVGPDYVRPETLSSAAPPFIGSASVAVDSVGQPDGDWWRLYQDPVLDGLVADALAANKDIAIATANLARARAALREVRSDRLPQTSVDTTGGYQRLSQDQTIPGSSRQGSTLDAGFSVSYEV
ncbi:MAG: TolC family protein, partial [Janthinobacterium lividum]